MAVQTEFSRHHTAVRFGKSAAYDEEIDDTIVAGAVTIDFRLGNGHTLFVDAAVDITLQEPNGAAQCSLSLDYAGNFEPTFLTPISWPDDVIPSWTKTNGKTDLVFIKWTGTKWRGAKLLNYTT